jgi:hypothetical protein
MKNSSKEPKVSHVNLVSDEEKKTDSSDEEKVKDSEEEIEEDPKEEVEVPEKEVEEKVEEDSEQTLIEIVKDARKTYKKGNKVASLSEEKPSSQHDGENAAEVDEEDIEDDEEETSSKKHGKGKDIAKVAAVIRAQRAEKIALRPMSRIKYFEFGSLETKG